MSNSKILILFCTLFYFMGYGQSILENKIYYANDFHKYKDEVKGKIGDVNCQILKFKNNQVTIYNYNRFIYNQTDFNDTLIFNLQGKYKQKTESYTIQNNELITNLPKYKYLVIDSINIKAYKNDDFRLLNISDNFKEISEIDFEKLTNNTYN